MSLELFIAKKIHFKQDKSAKENISSPAIKIAIAGVAIALFTMILAVAIVFGFKKEVRNKIIGFGGHLQIENYQNKTSHEKFPIFFNDSLKKILELENEITAIEPYIIREGIIKTSNDFQGIIFKGVDNNFDWNFFKQHLVDGNIPVIDSLNNKSSLDVLISKNISDKLNLHPNDTFITYFFRDKIQARKFRISGIYNTNFDTYDKLYVIGPLQILQNLNKWNKNQVTGIEIKIDNFDKLETVKENLFKKMIHGKDAENNSLYTQSIKDINPYLFDWLDLMDMNVWTIIILMFAVSAFTMTSGILILILEQTNMIGILKAMGLPNYRIQKTFVYVSAFIILKGMLLGNIFAFIFIFLEKWLGFVKLDPDVYYMSEMPVYFNIWHILIINILVLAISVATMLLPTYIISKITPSKAIKFE